MSGSASPAPASDPQGWPQGSCCRVVQLCVSIEFEEQMLPRQWTHIASHLRPCPPLLCPWVPSAHGCWASWLSWVEAPSITRQHCPVAQRVLAVPLTSIAPCPHPRILNWGHFLEAVDSGKLPCAQHICWVRGHHSSPVVSRKAQEQEGPEVLLDVGAIACCCRLCLESGGIASSVENVALSGTHRRERAAVSQHRRWGCTPQCPGEHGVAQACPQAAALGSPPSVQWRWEGDPESQACHRSLAGQAAHTALLGGPGVMPALAALFCPQLRGRGPRPR